MTPIKPENRDRYPRYWPEISRSVKEHAEWRCECEGECGNEHVPSPRCHKEHGQLATGQNGFYKIVLTVAHLDHTPENCDLGNLKAMCQGCHLRYDAPRKKADRLAAKAGSEPPFGTETA